MTGLMVVVAIAFGLRRRIWLAVPHNDAVPAYCGSSPAIAVTRTGSRFWIVRLMVIKTAAQATLHTAAKTALNLTKRKGRK